MAQTTSFTIANDSGLAVRARINEVIAALLSSSAGTTAPAITAPGMFWFDTSVTPAVLRRRNAADDAWLVASAEWTAAGLALAEAASATAQRTLLGAVAMAGDALAGGFTTTAADDGTKSSGTYKPVVTTNNIRRVVNGGAVTFAAPDAAGDYTLLLQVTNNASAGAWTFTGFAAPEVSAFTTVNGAAFNFLVAKLNGKVSLDVRALQ